MYNLQLQIALIHILANEQNHRDARKRITFKRWIAANKARYNAARAKYDKKWKANNRERNLSRLKEYHARPSSRARSRQLRKQRMLSDPGWAMGQKLRIRLHGAVAYKSWGIKITELIGCSMEDFKRHIESKFQEGMTWENRGYWGWHIDHIIPMSSFDMSKREEQLKCFHYTNLQPLWRADNILKSNKIQTDCAVHV